MTHPADKREGLVSPILAAAPPTTELGRLRPNIFPSAIAGRFLDWTMFVDETEYVPDLIWPQSIQVFDKMRTDTQLGALYKALTLPIRRMKFMIEPNGARQRQVKALSEDLNLEIVGSTSRTRGRLKRRFSFYEHLRHALLACIYGHMYFEQVGEIQNGLWRLRKLAPRMPKDIQAFRIADDGGLISIQQKFTRTDQRFWEYIEIPVDRLVAYVSEQEGANWVGRSTFRDCYRNWLVKDRLIRVDAINHERAGGVPWIEAAPGATPDEIAAASQMAQKFKVGEESGGAVPAGSALNIARLGSGTDVINSINYHDEAMARDFLHMFMQLGSTQTGSRALGETFVEYAFIAQKAVAQWFVDVFNEHVIEDWIDWNYGEQTQEVPLLTYVVQEEDELIAVGDLVSMVHEGIITVDPELEESLRERFKLPEKPADQQPQENVPPLIKQMRTAQQLATYEQMFQDLHDRDEEIKRLRELVSA